MTYLLTILIALTLGIDDPQPRIQQAYRVVEGDPTALSDGTLIRVRKIGNNGTGPVQTMYLQHRSRDTPINMALMHKADIVFYCYPDTHWDERYALKDAGGKVYTWYDAGSKLLILFDDSKKK